MKLSTHRSTDAWAKNFFLPILASLLLALGATVATSGCKTVTAPTAPQTLAPGAVNQTDQSLYSALMVAQASLNSLKTSAAANPQLKPYVNQAITDYNVAEAAWQTYHTAVSVSSSASPAAAQAAINKVQADLSSAPKVN